MVRLLPELCEGRAIWLEPAENGWLLIYQEKSDIHMGWIIKKKFIFQDPNVMLGVIADSVGIQTTGNLLGDHGDR